ncbi:MAG: dockerin type I domain-containing protein [Chthoniobacterales bacterium]
MKHPTLQKVMLATVALVASLALSAQAGQPRLSTAKSTHGSKPIHFLPSAKASKIQNPADFTYVIDDGTAEDSIGLTLGGEIVCLNEFAVIPGAATLTSLSIAWGTPAFPDPTLDGLPYTVAVWSDPNGDGNPTDAVLLTTGSGVIADQGTNTFITTNITPTTITTANFFVGFAISHNSGQFPAAFDESNPQFNRSYVAGSNTQGGADIMNLNDNDLPVNTIEFYGLDGNWLIRATANGSPSPTPTPTPTPTPAGALWYNGDFNGVNGLSNEDNTSLGSGQFGSVYDDFIISDPTGWDVSAVYSDNLSNTNITGATWEIRQGVSEGNGGTLIASGMTVTPIVTATGRSGFGYIEYQVEVTGLSFPTLAAGTYWLNVTPIGDLTGRSFDSTTSGANAIGNPPGNDQNAFFNSNFFGANFTSTANEGQPYDFSMGVNGMVHGQGGLMLTSAASRKTHGARGTFDIPLPGVECRSLAQRNVTVFTFSGAIASVGSTTSSCGTVASTTISGNTVLVSYNAAGCNGQTVTVTLNNVTDTSGNNLASASAATTNLTGDVNGDGVVNNGDVNTVKAALGQKTNSANFRDDVTLDGKVNNQDLQTVKSNR